MRNGGGQAAARRIVLMGVAGSGKTSVGERLGARLGMPYLDGDRLHPQANIDKMAHGIPLRDADRRPWLDRVARALAEAEGGLVLGCSALKRVYRDRIRAGAGGPVLFVHLSGTRAVIAGRMAHRPGHFMPTSLLDSQFASLEPPGPDETAIIVDIDQPLAPLVAEILARLPR